jgi:DNA (cytosine-5)-methyltransferase 1
MKAWGYTEESALKDVIHFDIQETDELINGNWSDKSLAKYGASNHSDVISGGLRKIIGDKAVDFIIGGPPCQAYSIHGRATDKNSMRDDYRNYLFESFVKVVKAFTPNVFVFENVPGILSAKPGGLHVTERIFEAFEEIGYEIRQPNELANSIFDAVNFNVPQYRKRVIILGVKKNGSLKLDDLYNSIASQANTSRQLTVKDAIGDLPKLMPLEQPIKDGRSNISHKAICSIPTYITQHIPRYNAIREINVFREWVDKKMNYISQQEKIDYYYRITGCHTLYAKYKNLEWDKPSHTVVAHLSKDGMMFIHPDSKQARSITVREAALLMSFPMDYEFIGSAAYCYKMIGNAVPVNFAKAIALGLTSEYEHKNQ